MKNMMIVITPNGDIETMKYEGVNSVKAVLGGDMVFISSANINVIPVLTNGTYSVNVDLIGGKNTDGGLNPFGTYMSKKEIHGNVVILKNDEGVNCGFDYREEIIGGKLKETFCECWAVKNTLKANIKANKKKFDFLLDYFKKEQEQEQEQEQESYAVAMR